MSDQVNELLFEHVVAGRNHPSVVAASLPSFLSEILGAATREDWQTSRSPRRARSTGRCT